MHEHLSCNRIISNLFLEISKNQLPLLVWDQLQRITRPTLLPCPPLLYFNRLQWYLYSRYLKDNMQWIFFTVSKTAHTLLIYYHRQIVLYTNNDALMKWWYKKFFWWLMWTHVVRMNCMMKTIKRKLQSGMMRNEITLLRQ